MNKIFARAMRNATDLTKSGRLQEATALIQSLLGQGQTVQPDPSPTAAPEDAIEGDFTRVGPDRETPTKPDAPTASEPEMTTQKLPAPKRVSEKPAPRNIARKSTALQRSPLAQTLRKIAAGGMPARMPMPAAEVGMPEGASFLSLTHTSAKGSRTYRLYVPANRGDGLMPLVVMLHGCTQTPEDFAVGTGMNALAEEFGCLVAWPAQPTGANAQKCWNWFRPQDQGRDRGEPALVAGLTRDILRDYPADPTRVYIAGLSAGGAAAAIIAAAWPDIFSAVGVHSGLPVGAASDVPSAFAAMRSGAAGKDGQTHVPTIVFHGTADSTVHPANGTAVLDQALQQRPGLRKQVRSVKADGRRKVKRTDYIGDNARTDGEYWEIDGAGHAWAGGQTAGSYTDPKGPDASREMLRFFLQHRRAQASGSATGTSKGRNGF